jgi:5-methylcytosine-specific restriction endonuclease McrA
LDPLVTVAPKQLSFLPPEDKVCATCEEKKPASKFPKYSSGNSAKSCYSCKSRLTYSRPGEKEKQIRRVKAAAKRREADGTAKDYNRRHRKAQRARWVAAGLTVNGTPRVKPPPRRKAEIESALATKRAAKECRAWHRRWLRELAPAECVLAWYAGIGKPWNNPRLTSGERFTVRYRTDDVFRAREIIKAQRRKESRAARIDRLSDGTVTPQALGAAFGKAKSCVYCSKQFKSAKEKTADHVNPLYLNGAHSMENIVIACLSCNSSKGRKRLTDWLTVAPQTSIFPASINSRSPTFSA